MANLITIDTAGISIQTYEEILADIVAGVRANVDPAINMEADSYEGQVAAICAAKLRDAAEAIQEYATSIDPDNAESAILDNVCAISGIVRLSATKSIVSVNVTCVGAWSHAPGELVAQVIGYPDLLFANRDAASAGGAGTTAHVFEAITAGAVQAPSGTLTVKISGDVDITALTNPLDATAGIDTETDAELRLRRERDMVARASSSVDGIRVAIEALTGVVSCTVRENTTLLHDADGIPGKAFEAIVDDRATVADDSIAQAIWDSKPAGIESYGNASDNGVATDAEGAAHDIAFTRPTVVNIYMVLTVKGNPDTTAVKDAIVAEAAAFGAGDDVEALMLVGAASVVLGVTGIVSYGIGTAPAPVGTSNVAIAARQRADVSASRITVTVV